MAHNSISPGFVKLYYTTTSITHVQTIPVIPSGTPTVGVMPNLTPLTGGPITLGQFMTDYMAVFRPFFSTITSVQSAEFWYAPTPTSDPIWIYDHPINLPGLTGAAASLMVQAVMTFRTALGGILKTYLMEPNSAIVANQRTAGASLAGINLNYSNYIKGATSCFFGRDNASPQVPIFLTTKVNDALRKRRMLM
jgi:hypothetical protein